jgi:hypothetical protein
MHYNKRTRLSIFICAVFIAMCVHTACAADGETAEVGAATSGNMDAPESGQPSSAPEPTSGSADVLTSPIGPRGEFSEYISGHFSDTGAWFIGNYGTASGYQENFIYLTNNGGETWAQVGDLNEEWSRVLTCGGFMNEKVGFLCYRYESERMGRMYCTLDGGETWELLEIPKLIELVGDGRGEAKEIFLNNSNDESTVRIRYLLASEGGADPGKYFSLSSKADPTKWVSISDVDFDITSLSESVSSLVT